MPANKRDTDRDIDAFARELAAIAEAGDSPESRLGRLFRLGLSVGVTMFGHTTDHEFEDGHRVGVTLSVRHDLGFCAEWEAYGDDLGSVLARAIARIRDDLAEWMAASDEDDEDAADEGAPPGE